MKLLLTVAEWLGYFFYAMPLWFALWHVTDKIRHRKQDALDVARLQGRAQ